MIDVDVNNLLFQYQRNGVGETMSQSLSFAANPPGGEALPKHASFESRLPTSCMNGEFD